MTTIDDVARLAGVSTATVSRALRGLPTVSETTRTRVLLAAEQLDYTASPSASRLAGGKTGNVAVIVPRITPWFVGAVVEAAEEILQTAGYDLLLYNIGGREHARTRLLHKASLPKRVDAVMLVATPVRADDLATIASLALPGVTVSSGLVVPGWPSIRIDDRAAGRTAAEHLLSLGHRRIACVWGDLTGEFADPAHAERRHGYQEALRAAGISPDPRLGIETRADAEGGRSATERLIARGELPTAIFASCDEVAMGVVNGLRLAGIRVPQQVSVIGIDDHDLAVAFGLTTVAQPAAEQGRLAAGTLLGPLAGRARTEAELAPTILPTRLVVRDSTGPARED
ncbi:LacI family DNA-binding transcriptional regulator [Plantactinospora endophytica]|uniref:HTH-type transcriptional regulator DegA n=1 Tax=Plantactinospora endophytica TaxID=673535 RepID=A0ABQ4EAU4_9ACTN|nr:LacI family DNA-binding transcriptional regulator [Plantactinospora endophytica]GIG91839.1 HTH-type transcriptional regulator DegA [Plantactinospora endophytica]